MDVVIIEQNGNIFDKKYDKDLIHRFATNPLYITEIVVFIPKEECYIYRVSQPPEKFEKNIHATNMVSNETNPLYGETMIIKVSTNNEIQNIDFDYLIANLINNVKIDIPEPKNNEKTIEVYHNEGADHEYYDKLEYHFGIYDPY